MATAPKSRLAPGEHSIDRATPREQPDGSWWLDWRLRLPSGRLVARRTKAATKTQVRARAKRTAAQLLTTGEKAPWSLNMATEKFIDEEAMRSLEGAGLAPSTVRLYTTALTRVKGEFKGLPLAEAATYGQLESALQEISRRYGLGAAKNAKKALNSHFVTPLLRHGLIESNPLAHKIDLASMAKEAAAKPRGSAELTNAHRLAVIDHLLTLDPAEGVPEKGRSRWSYAHRLAYRQNSITQTLLQASTGLRLQEAVGQARSDIDADGWLTTTFPKPVRVGGVSVRKPRTIPVLDRRVTVYLDAHEVEGSPWVLPNPADPARPWGAAASKEAMATLYRELADELGIQPLQTLRSHAWRTAINRHLITQGVPTDVRTAYLGHTAEVNAASYTHGVDLSAITALIPKSPKNDEDPQAGQA